jgi:hypothetical protein
MSYFVVAVGVGVAKIVTVGTGVGCGAAGTRASPGLFLPALRTTLTTPSAEKFG